MITEQDIQAIVDMALEPEVQGGSIRLIRPTTGPTDAGVKVGSRVPKSEPAALRIGKMLHATIRLDWEASTKKEPRSYLLEILRGDGSIETARQITIPAEPVTLADLQNEAMRTALVAAQEAAGTIGVPFAQLKELNEFQRNQIEAQAKEILRLTGRVAELEGKRSAVVDTLSEVQEQRGQALVHQAQAEAIRTEALARSAAWGDIGKAMLVNAPRILQLAAHALKLNPPPTLGAGPMPQTPGVRTPHRYTPPSRPMSPEAIAKLRTLAAVLDTDELSKLVKFAWDMDPDGTVLLQVLKPEHHDAAMAVFVLLTTEWGV